MDASMFCSDVEEDYVAKEDTEGLAERLREQRARCRGRGL